MKTHQELGITEIELTNLIKVRDMLAEDHLSRTTQHHPKRDAFNMESTCSALKEPEHQCGTVMCIGGWMKALDLDLPKDEVGNLKIDEDAAHKIDTYIRHSEGELRLLFWPRTEQYGLAEGMITITKPQAVKAINNYLYTGHSNWDSILTRRQARGY